jgi:hypothetical protein
MQNPVAEISSEMHLVFKTMVALFGQFARGGE